MAVCHASLSVGCGTHEKAVDEMSELIEWNSSPFLTRKKGKPYQLLVNERLAEEMQKASR